MHDELIARAGNDLLVGGSGLDHLLGGAGADHSDAREGQRDVVDCGPGRDIALVDRADSVSGNCETVRRQP